MTTDLLQMTTCGGEDALDDGKPSAGVDGADLIADGREIRDKPAKKRVSAKRSGARMQSVPVLFLEESLGVYRAANKDEILGAAECILRDSLRTGAVFSSPSKACDYLRVHIGTLEHEVFGAVFLDAQHKIIAVETLFRGTLTQTSVYPREVVKRALQTNAGGLLFFHNHPSGVPEPSRADEILTKSLTAALSMVDVRVVDHIVVGPTSTVSFAERGLI